MFFALLKREILDNLQSARFTIIFVMCSLLVLLSLAIGAHDYGVAKKQYEVSSSQMQEMARQQVTYQALGVWGLFRVYRPPSALLPFAKGLEQSSGTNTTVSVVQEPKLQDSLDSVEPIYAQFNTLDFHFVVRVVVALFALMLSFDLINGERDAGTLKLVLSHPVPRTQFILAKLAGAWSSLLLPLLLPILIGVLAIAAFVDLPWQGEEWARIGLMLLASSIYLGLFVALGVWVSSCIQRPSNALLILVLIWLSFVWVLPRVSLYVATQATRLPALHEVERDKWEIDRQWYRDSVAVQQQWLSEHRDQTEVPVDVQTQLLGALQNDVKKKKARIDEEYTARTQERNQWVVWMARVSPAAAFENVMLALSSTQLERQEQFLAEVKQYRNSFSRYVGERMNQEMRDMQQGNGAVGARGLDLAGMPQFTAPRPQLARDLQRIAPDLAVLLAYLVTACLLSYWTFLNYRVV